MLDIISELAISSSLLDAALDRYQLACSAVRAYYLRPTVPVSTPHALSSYVAREISAASSYETKLKQAKSIIGQARNHSFIHSKIHSFPTEVLARIFQLVANSSCGIKVDSTGPTSLPKYPERLSHVCSRWRRIAISLPALWTHIDLIYAHPMALAFVKRAREFASRTKTLRLDVHVQVPTSHDDDAAGSFDVGSFLTSVAFRVSSFKWVGPNLMGSSDEILARAFESFYSGRLTRLNMTGNTSEYTSGGYLIASGGSDEENLVDSISPIGLDICMSRSEFEELLLPVKVLQLKGIYPYWTSLAYHGLVELRLSEPDDETFQITSSELCSILQSSPSLAVLHFGLRIAPQNQDNNRAPQVCLQDLAELNLSHLGRNSQLALFFGLLAPVSNPLRVAIKLDYKRKTRNPLNDETIHFLKNSHVTELHLDGSSRPLLIGNILALVPRLRVLALRNFHRGFGSQPTSIPAENTISCILPSLDVIYVLKSNLDLVEFSQVIKRYPSRTVVLWESEMRTSSSWLARSELVEELRILCPLVKCIELETADPIEDLD